MSPEEPGSRSAFPWVMPDSLSFSLCPGLDKRELFAVMCLQGLVSYKHPGSTWHDLAEEAVDLANALLEALDLDEEVRG